MQLLTIALCLLLTSGEEYSVSDVESVWEAYDNFNQAFLDSTKYIYRDNVNTPQAIDRWHGAAAIWCQAIFFDMALQAYKVAKKEKDVKRMKKYRTHAERLFEGNRRQYEGFDFDDCNTNTGWFVYDDIMWWSIALARAYDVLGKKEYLQLSKRSFERVWNGSDKVGDDGSYADPEHGLGGGMFWEWQPIDHPKPHMKGDFRSACINFPTVIAASMLYQHTHQKEYLKKAMNIYQWADTTLVRQGRVADGIHNKGPEWNDHLYNQGTYIGASYWLYCLTRIESYLERVEAALQYTSNEMTKEGILPREFGPEQGVYTAIFSQYATNIPNEGFHFTPSIEHFSTVHYDDVYHASGFPAMLLYSY